MQTHGAVSISIGHYPTTYLKGGLALLEIEGVRCLVPLLDLVGAGLSLFRVAVVGRGVGDGPLLPSRISEEVVGSINLLLLPLRPPLSAGDLL